MLLKKNFFVLVLLSILQCLFSQQLPFPPLSGKFQVGVVYFSIKEETRPDILSPSPEPSRCLSVTAYYPIDPENATGETASYVPGPMVKAFAKAYDLPEAIGACKNRSFPDKVISHFYKKYPIVVFSPGFDSSDIFYTALLEEIASYGYCVVSVSLPYISGPVYIPEEKRVIEMPPYNVSDTESLRKRVMLCLEEGVKDITTVLQSLSDWNASKKVFQERLDLEKVILMGHSMGGMIASVYCSKPHGGIVGGINLDGGGYSNPEPDHTGAWPSRTDIPFLKIRCLMNAVFDKIPSENIGPNQCIIDGERFYHQIFCDTALFRDAFPSAVPPPVMPFPMPKEGWLPGKIAFKLNTGHILAFLNKVFYDSKANLQSISKTESEIPLGVKVAAVREIGPLSFKPIIRGRDGGYSTQFQDRSVWAFGDTVLDSPGEDGSQWRSSTWCWTRDLDAKDGIVGFDEPVDAKGASYEFLPFTAEELKYNKANAGVEIPEEKRSRYALWPGPIVVDPATGKGYVFYVKIFAKCGDFNFYSTGHSVALWESPDKPLVRPKVRQDGQDPTLLFLKEEGAIGQAAVVSGEWVYVYGCDTKELSWPCIVARVSFANLLNRNEWQFFAGNGKWSKDLKDAISIMDASPMLTVHWNEYLGKYLALYSTPLKNTISIRTSDHPEGPWSQSQVIHQCLPPTNPKQWSYSGLAHPEFAREKGRIEYFSYYRETGFFLGEIRLVEIVLEKE
ncbi:MAG: DUF4185 domain-containing protein [Candidatus Brocadiae bacterium]|nr:DUF4185 domain-containing protein [Candidatus Brocadiia bacterium]